MWYFKGHLLLLTVLMAWSRIQCQAAEPLPATPPSPAASRILERVQALRKTLPQLENLKPPEIDDSGNATLYVERGVTWKLEDPTQPASKLNARIAEFAADGFWVRLHFYRGPWRGAAFFSAIDLGDNQNLWFSYGYKPGDDSAVITAISKIIEAERPRVEKR
jgi:hypothetical protein